MLTFEAAAAKLRSPIEVMTGYRVERVMACTTRRRVLNKRDDGKESVEAARIGFFKGLGIIYALNLVRSESCQALV